MNPYPEDRQPVKIPYHLGIIMDGNGRWAQKQGLPRSAGHQCGVQTARQITEDSLKLGIQVLTLYAFSTENWNRPAGEVDFLMVLFEEYARSELPALKKNGIRFQHLGRRTGLSQSLLVALDQVAGETRCNSQMTLNLALNYGGRAEIVDAIKACLTDYRNGVLENPAEISELLFSRYLYSPETPEVDMIVRSGGEYRKSNFLLWQSASAVFWSTPVLWPDFRNEHLLQAVELYNE